MICMHSHGGFERVFFPIFLFYVLSFLYKNSRRQHHMKCKAANTLISSCIKGKEETFATNKYFGGFLEVHNICTCEYKNM